MQGPQLNITAAAAAAHLLSEIVATRSVRRKQHKRFQNVAESIGIIVNHLLNGEV
jgi:hypothetical protein